jgi:Transposase IS200 like
MLISVPPKYVVSQVVGFIKGKSAIHLARVYGEKKRNFVGQHFWARGYFGPFVLEAQLFDLEQVARPSETDCMAGHVGNTCASQVRAMYLGCRANSRRLGHNPAISDYSHLSWALEIGSSLTAGRSRGLLMPQHFGSANAPIERSAVQVAAESSAAARAGAGDHLDGVGDAGEVKNRLHR